MQKLRDHAIDTILVLAWVAMGLVVFCTGGILG